MLDQRMRKLLEPGLTAVAIHLARAGVRPNHLTLFGAAGGIAAGCAVAADWLALGLLFGAVSRAADGLDGPLARLKQGSDFGGYLDIVCDFVFYAVIPLGFAVRDPDAATATAFLLTGYLLTGVSFLAFSAIAQKRGIVDDGDNRSFLFQPGLAEGTETLAVYLLMFLRPDWYATLAWGYFVVCAYTALSRSVLARRLFAHDDAQS
jgi:phosphatidylglycerophosphate synthase